MMAYFIGALIYCLIFGFITKYVAESKGYEGGFWWGFFLGVIGLLVVGFRPDKNQTRNNYNEYSSSYTYSTPIQHTSTPRETKKSFEKTWTCIQCGSENPEKAKFCFKCGEARHYEWKCSRCGAKNGEKVRFCFQCGKAKEEGEEINPDKIGPIDMENDITIDNLKENINGRRLQLLIDRIEKDDCTWVEPEQLGKRGELFVELGIVKKRNIFAPIEMSEQEAINNGFTSWQLINHTRRHFKMVKIVPDISVDALQKYIEEKNQL